MDATACAPSTEGSEESRTRRRTARRARPASQPVASAPTSRTTRGLAYANIVREQAAPARLVANQAAAAWHVLTLLRTVEAITGPADGKTRVLAAIAGLDAWWSAPTSQRADQRSRQAGHRVARREHHRAARATGAARSSPAR